MIPRRILAAVGLLCALIAPAHAQQNQCRTSPVGASTAYCASEAFVTQSAAAVPVLPPTTKAQQQAGTSNSVAVTPLHQQDHPSAAKAWVNFTGSGTNGAQTINASYNVSGVSRIAAGNYVITFSIPFASANYATVITGISNSVISAQILPSPSAGSLTTAFISGGAGFDPTSGMVACFGGQ